MKKVRDSRFELLRIVSIFMITLSHFAIYGNWHGLQDISPLETVKILVLDMLGPIGAVIFFMITGYFHSRREFVEKKQKNLVKVRKIWLKTWGYSILMLIVSILLGLNLSHYVYLKTVLPILMNEYWFVTCYIVLVILIPYIDLSLERLTEKQFKELLLILMLFMFVELVNADIINRLVLTIFAYSTGFYINNYSENIISTWNRKRILSLLAITGGLDILSIYVSRKIGMSFAHSAHFTQYVLPMIIGAIVIIITIKVTPFRSKIINLYAASVLPIYLITENVAFSHYMWAHLLNVGQYQESNFFYVVAIIITAILCLVCSSLDIVLSAIFARINHLLPSRGR